MFTAIHLNVGPEAETTLQWWIRKVCSSLRHLLNGYGLSCMLLSYKTCGRRNSVFEWLGSFYLLDVTIAIIFIGEFAMYTSVIVPIRNGEMKHATMNNMMSDMTDCRQCRWVSIAVVSPEVMLYTAGKQWFSASRLCKKLSKNGIKEFSEAPTIRSSPFWSDSQAPVKAVGPS